MKYRYSIYKYYIEHISLKDIDIFGFLQESGFKH